MWRIYIVVEILLPYKCDNKLCEIYEIIGEYVIYNSVSESLCAGTGKKTNVGKHKTISKPDTIVLPKKKEKYHLQ